MKRCLYFFISILFTLGVSAQSNATIQHLKKEHNSIKQQISASERLLKSTRRDVGSQLNTLSLISSQIRQRQSYIRRIEKDMATLNRSLRKTKSNLDALEKDVKLRKKKYAKALRYLYRHRSVQDKLLFIFSANSLSKVYRRMRYVQQYSDFQRDQVKTIEKKQTEIREKKKGIEALYRTKKNLIKGKQKEKQKLEKKTIDKKELLASLQKKEGRLQKELKRKREAAIRLNKKIDHLIEIEIKKAQERAVQEQALAARKTEKKKVKKEKKTTTRKKKVEPKSSYTIRLTKADRAMSSSFARNIGNLPVPITGPHLIVEHFGKYRVPGLKHVTLENKGINIQGKGHADAIAVFNGVVSAVYKYSAQYLVLVRHGEYISVYSNLSSVCVEKGMRVKTKQVLGRVYHNNGQPILHFQLRKGKKKLNPEPWLRN